MSRARTLAGAIGSDGAVIEARGGTGTTAGNFHFKNRIINGAMVIDQRNAGAAVTISGTGQPATLPIWSADRFAFFTFGAAYPSGVYCTLQQVADAPSGFTYSQKVTANQALTLNSSNVRAAFLQQVIEGYNFLDCWNQTLTLSFWVKTSNPGTYSMSFSNGGTAAYATSYVVNAANTWEKKTITFTHSTSLYTPSSTNGAAMSVIFGLGGDSTWIGTATANQWVSGNIPYLHGCKNLFDTAGATFQVTGVQLEKGSTATSFDYRPYGAELALCQRYFYSMDRAPGNTTAYAVATCYGNDWAYISSGGRHPVEMRAIPTLSTVSTFRVEDAYAVAYTVSTITLGSTSRLVFSPSMQLSTTATAGRVVYLQATSDSSRINLSAEL